MLLELVGVPPAVFYWGFCSAGCFPCWSGFREEISEYWFLRAVSQYLGLQDLIIGLGWRSVPYLSLLLTGVLCVSGSF